MKNFALESNETYKKHLVDMLSPVLYKSLHRLYKQVVKYCKDDRKILAMFQSELQQIPKWSNEIKTAEINRIITEVNCKYLDKLLINILNNEAYVLSNGKKMSFDMPDFETYLFTVFSLFTNHVWSNCNLFYTPGVNSHTRQKNYRECLELANKSIISGLDAYIPYNKILESNLNGIDSDSDDNLSMISDYDNILIEETRSEYASESEESEESEIEDEPEEVEDPMPEVVSQLRTICVLGDKLEEPEEVLEEPDVVETPEEPEEVLEEPDVVETPEEPEDVEESDVVPEPEVVEPEEVDHEELVVELVNDMVISVAEAVSEPEPEPEVVEEPEAVPEPEVVEAEPEVVEESDAESEPEPEVVFFKDASVFQLN